MTILCATFRHRQFIADALRGFLGQKTKFPFRIVVRDDGSDDGTASVIRKFVSNYPNIIFPILEPRNFFTEGVSPADVLRKHLAGDFIVECEGDDYWISPDLLQKSVDLLQNFRHLEIACSRVYVLRDGQAQPSEIMPRIPLEQFNSDSIMHGQWPRTLTRVGRRSLYDRYFRDVPAFTMMDSTFVRYTLFSAPEGANPIGLIDQIMGVYRVHSGGIWSGAPEWKRGLMVLKYARYQLAICPPGEWRDVLKSEVLNSCKVVLVAREPTPLKRIRALRIAMFVLAGRETQSFRGLKVKLMSSSAKIILRNIGYNLLTYLGLLLIGQDKLQAYVALRLLSKRPPSRITLTAIGCLIRILIRNHKKIVMTHRFLHKSAYYFP